MLDQGESEVRWQTLEVLKRSIKRAHSFPPLLFSFYIQRPLEVRELLAYKFNLFIILGTPGSLYTINMLL